MNEIQIFKHDSFGQVRVISDNGEPAFCLSDVCQVLALSNPAKVKTRLGKGVTSSYTLQTPGGPQLVTFINEDGLYDVILDSRKPEAKQFRKWVTSEVLPSIRKTGGYIQTTEKDTPETIMAKAVLIAQETIKEQERKIWRQQQQIKEAAPKVLFADAVATSRQSCLVGELAKILRQNGINIGQNRLFVVLRSWGYLCSNGERYNQPTQKSMDMGLFELKRTAINKPDGTVLTTSTTKVTGKGQIYFVNKFLGQP